MNWQSWKRNCFEECKYYALDMYKEWPYKFQRLHNNTKRHWIHKLRHIKMIDKVMINVWTWYVRPILFYPFLTNDDFIDLRYELVIPCIKSSATDSVSPQW